MKLVKTFGLAAIAAMVAMAFVGASSASATFNTVLCEKGELICESPVAKGGNVEIHAETKTPPKLLSSLGTVECENSLSIVTLLNKLAVAPAKQVGHILKLEFTGNCHLGETSCEITVGEVGALLFLKIGKLEAEAVASVLEGGTNTVATVKCGSFINCKFSASAETKLTAHSDAEGHLLLLAKETPLKGSGFLCPATSKWLATYHAVNLDKTLTLKTGLYIES